MPLTVQYASDLHLEFSANRDFLDEHPIQPMGEVLVLGGDIVPFAIMHKQARFFDYLSDQFAAVYWMPGNHEYYGVDIQKVSGEMNKSIKNNVFLVNNTTAQYKDTTFIFSTLWSAVSPANHAQLAEQFNDFSMIQYDGAPLTVSQYNQIHENNLEFVTNALSQTFTGKSVVCTHHAPTLMQYPAHFKNNPISEVIATELTDLIEATTPDAWIYGHDHTNVVNFRIGDTLLATNQLGYVQQQQHGKFNTGKYITL